MLLVSWPSSPLYFIVCWQSHISWNWTMMHPSVFCINVCWNNYMNMLKNLVSLTIDNQKNGKHSKPSLSTQSKLIMDVVWCVHWLHELWTCSTWVCQMTHWSVHSKKPNWCQFVQSSDIVCAIKEVVVAIGLASKGGYNLKNVGSNSLRGSGSMTFIWIKACHWNIQCDGQWTSNNCLVYIHY